jgi:hypothetical protein
VPPALWIGPVETPRPATTSRTYLVEPSGSVWEITSLRESQRPDRVGGHPPQRLHRVARAGAHGAQTSVQYAGRRRGLLDENVGRVAVLNGQAHGRPFVVGNGMPGGVDSSEDREPNNVRQGYRHMRAIWSLALLEPHASA